MYCDRRVHGAEKWYLKRPDDAGMRVPDEIKNCVCFLLTEKGGQRKYRGTGFFVAYRDRETDDDAAIYLVTAKHVVEKSFRIAGHVKARLNDRIGAKIVELPTEWAESETADLAVLPWSEPGLSAETRFVLSRSLATNAIIAEYDIGIGDELLIAGLFTQRHGANKNIPIVRSGIIAAMPEEPLEDKNTGELYSAYLAEVRSIGGLSGSPAFVFISDSPDSSRPGRSFHYSYDRMLLLGVVRGHWDLPKATQEDFAEQEEKLNMGIAVLTPAQELRDLLESDKLKQMWHTKRQREREENTPMLDATTDTEEQETDEPPFTKADFEAALKKVARKIEPEK